MSSPAQVAEFERRLRWPALPTLVFLGFLVVLLLLVGLSMWLRPDHPRGLPVDAALLAEAGLPDATFGVLLGALRFEAAALGGAPSDGANDAAALERVAAAERVLERWSRHHPAEPRSRAALGALALVRHDYLTAANRYREACERSPHYGEGRLGWGVALAREAALTSDPWQRRALALRAIAQFAAVDPADPVYLPALYNRTRTLAEVGRHEEARTFAARYLAREPAGAWADQLRKEQLAK
jgi:tetratricopeptide (TPR) repeat protein